MKRISTIVGVIFAVAACSSGESDPVQGWIITPEAGDVVSESIDVQVGYEGSVALVELVIGDDVVADLEVEDPSEGVSTLTWDTTTVAEGEVELMARVVGTDDSEHLIAPVAVVVDNTAPVASIDEDRMAILLDEVEVAVTIDEANVETVRLLSDHAGEVAMAEETVSSLTWDTTAVESRVHWVTLEVTDVAGNVFETDEIPLLIGNNGYLFEQGELQYNPSAWLSIPAPYDSTLELDRRIVADQGVPDADPENIVRVVSWINWDNSDDWNMEYSIGQGICPHRGVAYEYVESTTGEAIVDIAWTEVPVTQQEAAMENDPEHPDGAETFPYNADPLTCGAFFGHVRALDAEAHAGGEVSFTANFMFIYGD